METNLVVISLDYDDCGDILFDEQISILYNELEKQKATAYQYYFRNYLCEITKSKSVELYVGSLRQSYDLDKKNENEYGNGSCFKNYRKLSEIMRWKFNEFSCGNDLSEFGVVSFSSRTAKNKIVETQLLNISKEHPDKLIDYYFFDDDAQNSILPSVASHLSNITIPKNIVNIHLIKHDWVPLIYNNIKNQTITLKAHIKNNGKHT